VKSILNTWDAKLGKHFFWGHVDSFAPTFAQVYGMNASPKRGVLSLISNIY